MGSSAELVNSRGDTLSGADRAAVFGSPGHSGGSSTGPYGGLSPSSRSQKPGITDPVRRSELLMNWLTAGGPPKPLDVTKIFSDAQNNAGVQQKASAGSGINGLFGIGNLIGDLSPKPIKPINQSPMQPGVPYGAQPVPGGK